MRFRLAVAGLAVVSALPLAGCKPKNAPMNAAPPGAQEVKIKARCNESGKVSFSIDKFAVEVRRNQNQTVWWKPDRDNGNQNDAVVTIVPKDAADWPFAATSISMPRDQGVGSGPVSNQSQGTDTVKYNIEFECPTAGQPRKVVIDPDIIIFDG